MNLNDYLNHAVFNPPICRILLTESRIDAEVFNNKGRSPLHVLARFGDDKACEMLDLFLECMPDYNIDRPDTEGNTPLLLAYIKVFLKPSYFWETNILLGKGIW